MSAKSSAQPGRRTPLSLSGVVTKSQPNKGANTTANGSSSSANGHQATSNNKQDNKSQQQKNDHPVVSNLEIKDNSNKRQLTQSEKKPQQNENKKTNEKIQNGMDTNKQQETNENKQQQQNKQQPNGNDVNKMIEEEKKEKSEKSLKDTIKSKEDKKAEQNIPENKKEEKRNKEPKEAKKEAPPKSDTIIETQQQIKGDDKKSKDEENVKYVKKNSEEKVENMDTNNQKQEKTPNTVTAKNNIKTNKTSTEGNKTQTLTKLGEKTPQKSTPTKIAKTTSVTKREVTTTIDDIEMEPLAVESSPVKPSQPKESANIKIVPSATSTPGKLLLPKRSSVIPKTDVQLAMQTEISPERPKMFSQISGRKSIRPSSDYTPSKFQSNLQFRESYRRINTELDVSNTSMNVTVGSEVPSNLSYSFFGYGRKRERTPPHHSRSSIGELHAEIDISPPKKVRLDINGLFSVVYSPITLLRNRFSKASLQSSTPVKLQQKINAAEDEIEVQNVSGVSVHEEIATSDKEVVATNIIADNNATFGEEAKETKLKKETALPSPIEVLSEKTCDMEQSLDQSEIKITETPLRTAVGDPMAKNKRCAVM